MQPIIRPAQISDHSSLEALLKADYHRHHLAHPETYPTDPPELLSEDGLTSILDDPEQAIFVAESGKELVGFIQLFIDSEEEDESTPDYAQATIENFYISDISKTEIIGVLLLKAAEDWAKEQEITTLSTITYAFDTDFLDLYKKEQFTTRTIRLNKEL